MGSDLFQNKYKISSARLQTWDYANPGMYFITICTTNRECYFGEIIDRKMQLSELGKMAETEWLKTVELRPDMNLQLGEFRVMPNHFHGIIIIGNNDYNATNTIRGRDAMHGVSTKTTIHNRRDGMHPVSTKFGIQSKNLSSIMRGYKSAVTTCARKNDILFQWQPRFHDHIIRSVDEYKRISDYIINNPTNWQKDKFFI
jgi:putative transposase